MINLCYNLIYTMCSRQKVFSENSFKHVVIKCAHWMQCFSRDGAARIVAEQVRILFHRRLLDGVDPSGSAADKLAPITCTIRVSILTYQQWVLLILNIFMRRATTYSNDSRQHV